MRTWLFLALAPALVAGADVSHADAPAGVTCVPVVFSGGHDTDQRDHGRPVILVASALGVPSQVFREAFSHVHPAPLGNGSTGPTQDEARQNKAALMAALAQYGVTNDRLDEVSNYYRYDRTRQDLWRVAPAAASALVKNGAVIGYEITSPGAGYSSPPTVTVPNYPAARPIVNLTFGKDLKTNGAISAISLPGAAGN